MKNLETILRNIDILGMEGTIVRDIDKISFDSRTTGPDDVYVALKGTATDGHRFIPEVMEKGTRVIVCENMPDFRRDNCTIIRVPDTHSALAIMSANYYHNPSGKINLVGVTGTNGKTTTATLLYNLFTDLGYKCGLLSTIRTMVAGREGLATHTTPDPVQINRLLHEMTEAGCEFAFMEVSSHAAVQKRTEGLKFRGGIFTNITHDHLDYHGDFRSYMDAKKSFFDMLPADAFALVNTDDRSGMYMVQNTKASVYTYAVKSMADFRAKIIESHFQGNLLEINGREMWTRLPGLFNTYNILAIYGTAKLLGADDERLLPALSSQQSATGRFQMIHATDGRTAIVDYAHTPDALENVIKTILEIRRPENKLITIVGAGGNRDKTKRPAMARIAAELSDKVILTSDNPRNEEPEEIINDMRQGLDNEAMAKVMSITDRREAIRTACAFAGKTDIILIAGKGHETYQEIKGVKYPFDDSEIVTKCFES